MFGKKKMSENVFYFILISPHNFNTMQNSMYHIILRITRNDPIKVKPAANV